MKKAIAVAAAAIVTCLTATAAEARVGDSQWAVCVWQSDQEGAANWLKMTATGWQDKYGSAAELLALRLLAECDPTPADPEKPNRPPNWKSVQQMLKRSQPKALPVSEPSPVAAKLCEYYSVKGTERTIYLAEAVRSDGAAEVTVYQAYFDQSGTGAINVVDYAGRRVSFEFGAEYRSVVRMPQSTLIASPSDGYTSEKSCRLISADGSLQ